GSRAGLRPPADSFEGRGTTQACTVFPSTARPRPRGSLLPQRRTPPGAWRSARRRGDPLFARARGSSKDARSTLAPALADPLPDPVLLLGTAHLAADAAWLLAFPGPTRAHPLHEAMTLFALRVERARRLRFPAEAKLRTGLQRVRPSAFAGIDLDHALVNPDQIRLVPRDPHR